MRKSTLLSNRFCNIAMRMSKSLRWTAIALALTLPSLVALECPSVARYRPPSNLERPDGRQGGGTRSGCAQENFAFAPLVPTSNYGQTIATDPTLYWYHANHTFPWARFELFATQNQTLDLAPQPIYQSTFRVESGTTLGSLTLPTTASTPTTPALPPLTLGRDYLWKVTLICSTEGPDDEAAEGSQRSVQGWIRRVEPSPGLESKLAAAPHRYDVYAEEGLWYDALHDLAEQRRQQPDLARLKEDWQTLLEETKLRANPSANLP
jgi:Domain of Unknown Function (DUF928)